MAEQRSHITDTRYTFTKLETGTRYHIARVRPSTYGKIGVLCGSPYIPASAGVDRTLVHEGNVCAKCIRSAKLARLEVQLAPAPKEEAPAE